jgi:hypothetical protein
MTPKIKKILLIVGVLLLVAGAAYQFYFKSEMAKKKAAKVGAANGTTSRLDSIVAGDHPQQGDGGAGSPIYSGGNTPPIQAPKVLVS